MSENKKENKVNDSHIKESMGKPPLTAEESAALDQTIARQESVNEKMLNAQKRVRILIPAGRTKHEQCPVSVGVNGRDYLIERGVEVAVPESVVHVLNLAVEQAPVMSGERITGFRSVSRYPMQVLGSAEGA